MKVSLNWLREFVEIPVEPRRLKTDLTGVGLNVESHTPAGDDWVFDVEITTNRPDCLSHYGVAREISTLYGKPLKRPAVSVGESGPPAAGEISIEIADPDLCARYCGRVIQNLRVGPSPFWLVKRLEAVGMRSINNVADITNYVLMELGHPLHAFDLARLKQRKIVVRRARNGEGLRTLDGLQRVLGPQDLVIADAERAVALAGVMGGEDSEISSGTEAVLLESAWFDPVAVRCTAKAQGMHTEASHRFERGADIEMAPQALDRTAALMAELAGGRVLPGVVDVYPRPRSSKPIRFRASEIRRILGAEISREEVERILSSLGFRLQGGGAEGWQVTPPSFRLDIALEVDLIEEVARHFGYDRLPARVRPAPPRVERDHRREKELTVSSLLVGLGYREIVVSSMVDPEENARFTDHPPVPLANPLSQEASVLRSSSVPSMLRALRWNLDRDQGDLRFFETARIYTGSPQGPEGLPEERRVLTLGLGGHRQPASVHDGARELGFFDLKGDLEALFEAFDLGGLEFKPQGCPYHEQGLGARFMAGDVEAARFGQLRGEIARDYKLRQTVWLAEIDLEWLLGHPLRTVTFRPYSKFPAVERDFSLVVPEGLTYSRLEAALRGVAREEVGSFRPVDLFAGGSVPAGHYSLLLRVTFQSPARTLTGEEIAGVSQQIVEVLGQLGVRLRG